MPCNDGTNIPSLEGRGSKGEGENKPSPQPSPTGEGAICHSEGCQEVRRSSNLDGKKIRRYEGKLFTLKSLSSNPPTLLSSNNHSGGNASLIPPYALKQRAAFTLAEVLITLGIIGVVAAMTMPSLIANYQKKQTVAQLKRVYSILSQALERSVLDNGPVETWDWDGEFIVTMTPKSFAEKHILAYINGVNKLSVEPDLWKTLKGTVDTGGSALGSRPQYELSDGTLLNFSRNYAAPSEQGNRHKTSLQITVDLNGYSGPNQFGRDVFMFAIFPFAEDSHGKLMPGKHEDCGGGELHYRMTRNWLAYEGCATCRHDRNAYGYGCAALIMKDGWEIKEDYPW